MHVTFRSEQVFHLNAFFSLIYLSGDIYICFCLLVGQKLVDTHNGPKCSIFGLKWICLGML